MTNKTKVLFYHGGMWFRGQWLYSTALYCKTYIDLYHKELSEHIEWCVPIQQQISNQDLVDYIEKNQVDILCTSHYIWNHHFLLDQLCEVKKLLKKPIIVIAGGPNVDVHLNENFFKNHPFIDYAVYGAGEQAFADIMTHLTMAKPLIAFNTSNCAWYNQATDKTMLAKYKMVKILETSPFLHNESMFTAMVEQARLNDQSIWLPYALTRGCPYACTFCDWNSGLGNKVSRRKNTYQKEIDLFQRLGITKIYLSDANVGQYQEDIDMIDYFAKKNINENAGFRVGGSFSKLKKANNLKIFKSMLQAKLNEIVVFAIQDIDQTVLSNIDRPDVGWDEHVAMANELKTHYPDAMITAQLIYALPGQTLNSWMSTLDQVTEQNIFPLVFSNEPLPASPALVDPEYQQKFQYHYVHCYKLGHNTLTYKTYMPKQSVSFGPRDIVQMTTISAMYQALTLINLALQANQLCRINIGACVRILCMQQEYKNLVDNLWSNWQNSNNFFYTIDYSGNSKQIGDNALVAFLIRDHSFLKFVASQLQPSITKQFYKTVVKGQLQVLFDKTTSTVD